MNKLPRLEFPDCAKDCEKLFELEREVEELRAERDTWARATEVRQQYYHAADLVYATEHDYATQHGPDEVALVAAAYAIAELGENWREELAAK